MAEYIEREALIAKFKQMELGEHGLVERLFADGVYAVIAAFPAADVVPVTRCKDCEYGDYDSKPDGAMVCLRTKDGFWRKETDFCSYGTPKNDGGET